MGHLRCGEPGKEKGAQAVVGQQRTRAPAPLLSAVAGLLLVAVVAGCGFGGTSPVPAAEPSPTAIWPAETATARATARPSRTPTRITRPSQVPSAGSARPSPTTPPRQPITKVSKMGVGVYKLHASGYELEALIRAQPSVLVLQDPDIGFARDVRYWFPKAFIIGRTFLPQQPLDNPEQRGTALADKVSEMAVPYKGLIDAWQSYNEPVAHNDYAGYAAYNKLQVAFARRLQDHYGIPAVAGNDPPGAIEPGDYPKYFGEAVRTSRYFGIHAYSAPNARTFNTPDAIYFGLRYRLIHDELEAAGIKGVQMVLTEAALGEGWLGSITEEQMGYEFVWLASQLEEDPYMKGMAVFGIFGDQGPWGNFNILNSGQILDIIGQYQPPADN